MKNILFSIQTIFRKSWIQITFLVLITMVAYSNSLLNQFLLDDYIDLFGPSGVAHKSYVQILTQPQGNFFRPLGPLFYKTCSLFFDQNPFGYHIANLLLFIGVVVLFYVILRKLIASQECVFFAVLLYAIHPVNAMLVDYTVASAITTYVLMLQCSFYCYILFSEKGSRRYLWGSILFFLLSLMAHEISLMLPFYLVAFLYFLRRMKLKSAIQKAIPFLGVGGAYLVIRFIFFHMNTSGNAILLFSPRWDAYFLSLADLILWYCSKLIFPKEILFLWSDNVSYQILQMPQGAGIQFLSPFNALAFLKLSLFFCAVLIAGWVLLKIFRGQEAFFGAIFCLGFLPCAYICFNYFPNVKPMIEPHWFYFSSIGFFVLIAAGLFNLKKRISFFVWVLLMVTIMLFCLESTRFHNRQWQDQEAYCQYWISLNKNHNTPYRGLGYAFLERGNYFRAAEQFQKSLMISPDVNARLFASYAYALYCSGSEERGMFYLQQAFWMEPQYALIHYYWGYIFLKQNRLIEAEKAFRNAMILNPYDPEYPKYVALVVRMLESQSSAKVPGIK